MSATVIIPTTGVPELKDAVESVLKQTYDTTCYVVIDGEENADKVYNLLYDIEKSWTNKLIVANLPINVGAKGFYGHRVYAAFTHLVNTEYVLYLDQDNWFEPNHIESCVKTIEQDKFDWSYSLRNIYNKDKTFLTTDDCESLGRWPTYHNNNHIDTNCYCIKTKVAASIANAWHGGWGQDRVFFSALSRYYEQFDCSKEYTVNYRVDGGQGSVNADFFINGNAVMNEKYNGNYPWRKKSS